MLKEFFRTYSGSLAKNLAFLTAGLVALIIIVELFNPFNLSFIDSAKDFLGINRESASEIQEIVAGKLEGRRLLAEATREYTGDYILERRGGPFNCAGEQQFINNGVGTARVVVPGDDLMFKNQDEQIIAEIPEPVFDSADLKEDLDVSTGRNPCARIVQLFGNVTSESEVRELLRSEIESAAKEDEELKKEASCNAKAQVESILDKSGVDTGNIEYEFKAQNSISCE